MRSASWVMAAIGGLLLGPYVIESSRAAVGIVLIVLASATGAVATVKRLMPSQRDV